MEVFAGHRALTRPLRAPAIAIGNFDGVHRGHAALIERARAAAAAADGESVVLTFEPHPVQVLVPELAPPRLTTPARKLELLEAAGVDVVIVEPFSTELAAMPAPAFVADLLVGALGAHTIVVGLDFAYGRGRTGTASTLVADAGRLGAEVALVEPVTVDGEVVSSTRIRGTLRGGDLERARRLLGRRHDVDGVVVRGAGRGRGLGIPTANLAPDGDLVLAPGIYAVTLRLLDGDGGGDGDGGPWHAVASLGTNPTFVDRGPLSFEVHVLDLDRDLYDRRVRVELVARLRDEARFDSVDALLAQIADDIARARAVFAAGA
ncbi:MAG TPA: bifunctional riboflavin kinase/FAD synthetase [Kofleriaceae bacterium]|nr:bifunctional riboflavin kinase/FAD synthetase [Kofleriaceae bacterium]